MQRGNGDYQVWEPDLVAEIIGNLARVARGEIAVSEANIGSQRREVVPDDVKLFVWKRDNGRCVKCGSRTKLEYDHIIPVSQGGSNTARNIQLLCETCNRSKGAHVA